MRVAALLLLASFACTTPALRAQTPDRFTAYEKCKFSDGLALVEATPLADGVEGRTVKTVMGPKNVPLAGGTRLVYAWPGTEPFANVKIEQIPADDYRQARLDLTANWEQILTADDSSERNYALKPRLNGLEIYGLDRKKLEGGVLGIYIFFSEPHSTAVTIYFLNQDANLRKFQTMEEYAKLRDAFLETFTGCAAGHAPPPANTVAAGRPARSAARSAKLPSVPPPALPAAPVPSVPAAAAAAAPQDAPVTPAVAAPTSTPAPSSTAAATSSEPYVPPEAAPLVHPRNAADRKAAAAKTAKKPAATPKKPMPATTPDDSTPKFL